MLVDLFLILAASLLNMSITSTWWCFFNTRTPTWSVLVEPSTANHIWVFDSSNYGNWQPNWGLAQTEMSLQSINQSIVKFITRYFQVLSVSPVMNRKRGWDSVWWKRCVFRCDLKDPMVTDSRTEAGSAFQTTGAALENRLAPIQFWFSACRVVLGLWWTNADHDQPHLIELKAQDSSVARVYEP